MGFCKRVLYALGANDSYIRSMNVKESELDFVYLPAAIDCRTLAIMRNILALVRSGPGQPISERFMTELLPISFAIYRRYCETLSITETGLSADNVIISEAQMYNNLIKCIIHLISTELKSSLCYDYDGIRTLLVENIRQDIVSSRNMEMLQRSTNGITFTGGLYWPQWQKFKHLSTKWGKFIYYDESQLLRYLNTGMATQLEPDFDLDILSGDADLKPPCPIEVDKLVFPAMAPTIGTQLTAYQSTINASTIFDSFKAGCVLVDGDNVSVPLLYLMLRHFHQKRTIKKILIICDTPPIFRWDISFPNLVTYEVAEHTRTKKNAGDILLAYRLAQLEASGNYDKFILVSSDSDYASLCRMLADKLLLLIDESRASSAYFNLLSSANVDFILMKDLVKETQVAKLLGLGGTPDYMLITHILMNGGSLWKS